MKQNSNRITPNVVAVAVGALVTGMVFSFALNTFAFVGPTQSPPGGSGAISGDSSNNIAIGTATPISGTRFSVLGTSNDASTYAEKIESNNQTPLLFLRDDGAVSIATSTVTAGDTIIGNNLVVGGTLTANNLGGSAITAGNVSTGTFGSNTGGGNYSFSGNVGIGTAHPNYLLDVTGAVNATQYCISGANCITSWPSGTGSGTDLYLNFATCYMNAGSNLNECSGTESFSPAMPDTNYEIICTEKSGTNAAYMLTVTAVTTNSFNYVITMVMSNGGGYETPQAFCHLHHA